MRRASEIARLTIEHFDRLCRHDDRVVYEGQATITDLLPGSPDEVRAYREQLDPQVEYRAIWVLAHSQAVEAFDTFSDAAALVERMNDFVRDSILQWALIGLRSYDFDVRPEPDAILVSRLVFASIQIELGAPIETSIPLTFPIRARIHSDPTDPNGHRVGQRFRNAWAEQAGRITAASVHETIRTACEKKYGKQQRADETIALLFPAAPCASTGTLVRRFNAIRDPAATLDGYLLASSPASSNKIRQKADDFMHRPMTAEERARLEQSLVRSLESLGIIDPESIVDDASGDDETLRRAELKYRTLAMRRAADSKHTRE